MELKPRVFGAFFGFVLSLLLVIFNWKVMLVVFGLTCCGYLIGLYLESGREIKAKIRELLSLFFR